MDWFELFNPGDQPVALVGIILEFCVHSNAFRESSGATFLLGCLLAFSVQKVIAQNASDLVERFKKFVSDPPRIQECVLFFPSATRTNVYRFRLQENASLVQQFESFAAYQAFVEGTSDYTGTVNGRYENYIWEVAEESFHEWHAGKNHHLRDQRPGQLLHGITGLYLSRWLNAGIQYVSPGAITWKGDQITVTNYKGFVFKAQLHETNGRPTRIVGTKYLTEKFENRQVPFEYSFTLFEQNKLAHIPQLINTRDGAENPTEWRISVEKLELADGPIDKKLFMPQVYLHRDLRRHVAVANNGTKSEQTFGDYRRKQRRVQMIFFAVCIIVLTAIIGVYFRRGFNQKVSNPSRTK